MTTKEQLQKENDSLRKEVKHLVAYADKLIEPLDKAIVANEEKE